MKINFTRGILLGVGLLGAATVITPAEAAPHNEHRDVKEARKDVKEAKKDVKEERRDLRKADTPGERREAREDLRDAQRDLRKEQHDLKDEKRDLKRPGYNGNYNNGYRPGNNGYRPGTNNGYRPGNNNGYRPGYNNGGYNNGYRPGNINSNNTTLEGRVSNDLKDNGVILRTNNGQNVRVTFSGGEPKQLGTGDTVRVTGYYSGSGFVARSVNIIRNR